MKTRLAFLAGVAVCGVLTAGCDESISSKQAKVRPPAATPTATLDSTREPLPLPAQPQPLSALYDRRPAIDILGEKVQVSFNMAEKEYKPGEFEKARADYDRAVPLIVASGSYAD